MKRAFLSYLVIISIFASASAVEFQVNTRTTYDQKYADIAADENGNFLVVWRSYSHPNDSDSGGIFGQRFTSDGTATGGEFQINTTTAGDQTEPRAASDGSGGDVNENFAKANSYFPSVSRPIIAAINEETIIDGYMGNPRW